MEVKRLNMSTRKLLTAILSVIIISSINALGQDPAFVPDRIVAERAFNNGDYTIALKHYEALSESYRADPVYKYYSGACLVNLERKPGQAVDLLKEAIANSSSIRKVPDKAWYILGRAYHLNGDYDLAIDAYDTFRDLARRREVREMGIDELIAQCKRSTGSIEAEKTLVGGGEEEIIPVEENIAPEKDSADAVPEQFPGPEVEYKKLAREALEYQFKADSVLRLADRYRSRLSDLAESDRPSVRTKILSLEEAGFEYQKIADQKYQEAARMASAKYDERIIPGYHGEEDTSREEEVEKDKAKEEADILVSGTDTTGADAMVVAVERPAPVLSLFSDEYEQEDIPVNPELPDGLLYRIQLAAFRNPQKASFFGGLGPLSIYRAEGSDINFYYTGIFRSKKEAENALVKVKQKPFKDAFIITMMDGSRISMEKAEQLENQWAHISLFEHDTVIEVKDGAQEPPTLVYRVQVMKVKKKAKDDELELLERLADKRSYDIFETDANEYAYLIGKFLTFESAASYADLLYRNGMKDAKVVAYMGNKEIPLETAKELFELYFEK